MKLTKFQTYYYYGTGADEINVQRELSFFVDTAVYDEIARRVSDHDTNIYKWEDLAVTPAEACKLVNNYLGFAAMGNDAKYYFSNPETDPVTPSQVQAATNYMSAFGFNYNQIVQKSGTRMQTETKRVFLNGNEPTNWGLSLQQYIQPWQTPDYDGMDYIISNTGNAGISELKMYASEPTKFYLSFTFYVLPDDFFLSDGVNTKYSTESDKAITIGIIGTREQIFPFDITNVNEITITCDTRTDIIYYSFNGLDLIYSMPDDDDISNPYGYGGISGTGGGDGTLKHGDLDDIDPATIPGLPGISAADLGFITMYNPSVAQLKSLSSFMWSNLFDLNTFKKLFSDPMQSIIGLAIVPVAPSTAGSKNVHFGSIDSGISMPYLSTNYVQLDCGSVALEKYVGCFMDNDPYTKISIYLPFVGIRQLSADDVIGGSIHVVYNIDVLNGACACFIEHSTRGVLYSYNGSCITNVPLTSINFSGAIQNAVSAIGSAIGMAAGMSIGAAPVAAMGALGLATSAANTAINSKPSVQRSGNLGGSAGIMSILTPYVIIERPALSVPSNVQHYVGQTSNITMSLGGCKGFTMCEYVHLDNLNATSDEIVEIEIMLKTGVIF